MEVLVGRIDGWRGRKIARSVGAAIEDLLRAQGVDWVLVKISAKNSDALGAIHGMGFVEDSGGHFEPDNLGRPLVRHHWLFRRISNA